MQGPLYVAEERIGHLLQGCPVLACVPTGINTLSFSSAGSCSLPMPAGPTASLWPLRTSYGGPGAVREPWSHCECFPGWGTGPTHTLAQLQASWLCALPSSGQSSSHPACLCVLPDAGPVCHTSMGRGPERPPRSSRLFFAGVVCLPGPPPWEALGDTAHQRRPLA